MMKPPFPEAKLYISERKQSLLCNRRAEETLIYEFNINTQEAAKPGLLLTPHCHGSFTFCSPFLVVGVSSTANIAKLHVKRKQCSCMEFGVGNRGLFNSGGSSGQHLLSGKPLRPVTVQVWLRVCPGKFSPGYTKGSFLVPVHSSEKQVVSPRCMN